MSTISVVITYRADIPEDVKTRLDEFAVQMSRDHQVDVAVESIDVCRRCGCTDDDACFGGCSWVNESRDLCSSCIGEPDAEPADVDDNIDVVIMPLALPNVIRIDPSTPLAPAPTTNPSFGRTELECPVCEEKFLVRRWHGPALRVRCPRCSHGWSQMNDVVGGVA
ncbi:hypothetical protein [Microbacterium gorillae]|uniref:hypothetical protein n=1 Tax=Microbacterium gorillae TaxID=1231063 RepID=UPI003D9740DD